ncbi:MAG: CrcB family protein [Nitrososphaerota archaeon]|nr:CrcB family protein [Nitrososphaerota archaeon]
MKWDILYLFAGAAVAVVLRYKITGDPLFFGSLPLSVLIVNIIGSFILGLSSTATQSFGLDQRYTLLIGIGFCGTLTTMSTFALESVNLLSAGKTLIAAADVFLNVGASMLAILAGRAVILAIAGFV